MQTFWQTLVREGEGVLEEGSYSVINKWEKVEEEEERIPKDNKQLLKIWEKKGSEWLEKEHFPNRGFQCSQEDCHNIVKEWGFWEKKETPILHGLFWATGKWERRAEAWLDRNLCLLWWVFWELEESFPGHVQNNPNWFRDSQEVGARLLVG